MSAVLTVTAVDTSTEELTITAHGLVTGDGPVAVRSPDGSLPTPLTGVTDYWVIRVDANNVKLATSSANAGSGTAIDLTAVGSWATLLLEIGLPYRRARTYVSGSQVKSVDLDSMQDDLIALHDLFTGQAQSIWTLPAYTDAVEYALGFEAAFDTIASASMATHTRDLNHLTFAASATPIYVPIRGLVVGSVITAVVCELQKNTANTNTVALDIVKINSAGETASGSGYSDSSNHPGVINFGGTFSITVATGYRYYVKITPGGGVSPAADKVNYLAVKSKLRA
jgi:hypothetical protein